jgi:hypothetical protein
MVPADKKDPPLLLGLITALKEVITWVLKKLEEYYNDVENGGGVERYVFLTISERSLERYQLNNVKCYAMPNNRFLYSQGHNHWPLWTQDREGRGGCRYCCWQAP